MAAASTPITLTTGASGQMTGKPATGPVTASSAVLLDNDFPVAAIDPNTNPAPAAGAASCSQANATLLNSLLGLPSIPDPGANKYPNTFYAPSTFGVYTSS